MDAGLKTLALDLPHILFSVCFHHLNPGVFEPLTFLPEDKVPCSLNSP
jgi:hypothetical protein